MLRFKLKTSTDKLLVIVAAIVAFIPTIVAELGGVEIPQRALLAIQLISWGGIVVLLDQRSRCKQYIEQAAERLGFKPTKGDVGVQLEELLGKTSRYHEASHNFALERSIDGKPLGSSLREIAEMTHRELGAKAVELSLFDKESGLWSQAIMLGSPDSVNTQGMLNDASGEGRLELVTDNQGSVTVEELSFAGSLFGALRVEMDKGEQLSVEDREVLKLLAMSGALLLGDSRFTEELLVMKRLGEESLKAKTGFLANLSHEIRGPLSVILNGAELTMDGLCGPVTDSQKDTLKMIKDNGDHLLELVNDVLDYAKVEAGKVSAKPVEILVGELIKDLLTLVRSQVTLKNHKVVTEDIDETLGIVCDKRHSRQILINFLTNAIKYTPEGGTITVGAERVRNGMAKIWIKDSGVGIPLEHHSKVFGAFERVDERYSNTQSGTGLGMPLTRKLAGVNEGSVDFESEVGQGSTFWVNLPAIEIDSRSSASSEKDEKANKSQSGKGEKVLIVDYNPDTREMYDRYLSHQGFDIIQASSGRDVLKVIREEDIELAVVENDMPDIDGEDMVLAIRANPKVSSIPIILLSSKAFVFDIEHFLKLGVDRCLTKPVELSELADTARRLIDETFEA